MWKIKKDGRCSSKESDLTINKTSRIKLIELFLKIMKYCFFNNNINSERRLHRKHGDENSVDERIVSIVIVTLMKKSSCPFNKVFGLSLYECFQK